MENTLLNRARKEYPSGTTFISASGALKSPLKVASLKESEVYKGAIYNSEGGCIYIDGKWAVKV
jgi:hypothetical protein